LSGGERQKVFIAAALAQGARILLLDEPTTFLDYRHQAEVMDLLRSLNHDEGLTLVAVTHDVNSGTLGGDRVLALKEGRLFFDGPPGDLLAGDALAAIYDTEFRFVKDPEGAAPIVLPRRARPV
jgi:iron complex transport system ATP-binding protein